jgi:small neutral amino acid transporter SnatA (MarC family)
VLAAADSRNVGVTARNVVMRVFAILAAITVQSVFNGIAGSGIFLQTSSAEEQ